MASSMQSTSSVLIRPARAVHGTLRLPGDKSISHRYALLAAIAKGVSRLENFSTGADCRSTLSCLQALGVSVRADEQRVATIEGNGRDLTAASGPLDCGNSGSTMRMISGILAAQSFASELIGDDSLSRRPMRRVIEPLKAMGADIRATDGHAPLKISGKKLRGIEYRLPVASAQVKTALLFAGLLAEGTTVIEEPLRTRDHGELALRAFGAEVNRSRNRASIVGAQSLHGLDAFIPGDISSAAFFVAAAALFPESELVIEGLLLNPTRAALLDVFTAMGVRISIPSVEARHGELIGTIQIRGGTLKGATISGALSASLIDELPVLAAIAPYTADGIEIRDASELRVKESDRIAVVAQNLRAMGAEVEEREDGLTVRGGQPLHGAEIDSAGDHRIAMAFAVAALCAKGDTTIRGADAARISFPEFFAALEAVVQR